MNKLLYIGLFFLSFLQLSCEDSGEMLDKYLKDGPITYAGKIESMNIQSGYYRVRLNVYPAADVNRSYCMISWNISTGVKDSVKMDYVAANYDEKAACYYTLITVPEIEGNLLLEAINVDKFGNKSLLTNVGAFIYGKTYTSTLQNSSLSFSAKKDEIIFEDRVGSVGNLVSYEQNSGKFTDEVIVRSSRFPLVDAKKGGIIRTKTRYLMTATDIDTLLAGSYLETRIPE